MNQDSEGAISQNKLEVGDFVSTDQFICSTPGRLPTGYCKEWPNSGYHGGTIYNDAASGLIWVENQVSLGASETLITLMGKERFEQWLYDTAYTTVKHIHGDNGIFASDQYQQECAEKGQMQSFSGVGAQHQNAKAERAIQTVMYMARTLWCMRLCIGQSMGLTTSLCGCLLSSMQSGYIIGCQTVSLGLL